MPIISKKVTLIEMKLVTLKNTDLLDLTKITNTWWVLNLKLTVIKRNLITIRYNGIKAIIKS